MYSRSLDPRRIPSALPSHYGGSAFRSDGTPTPIPVKREHDIQSKPAQREDPLTHTADNESMGDSSPDAYATLAEEDSTVFHSDKSDSDRTPPHFDSSEEGRESESGDHSDKEDTSFLSRLLGGILPGVREDDLLLLLLILLLSKEDGNEDILLLLAFLLFAK